MAPLRPLLEYLVNGLLIGVVIVVVVAVWLLDGFVWP